MSHPTDTRRRGRRFLDPDHPFFRPLWVRILVPLLAIGWGIVELALGNLFWAVIFMGLGFYAGWGFFVALPRGVEDSGKEHSGD